MKMKNLKKNNHNFLLLTSFVTGSAIMILEILGFRLLAPYFGYSVYVWGSLIGIIMVALSAGYYYGGRIADKNPDLKLIYSFILLSGLYTLGVLFFHKSLLSSLSELGVIYGSLVSTSVIFGPPMILLSMVSPFFIKVISKEDNVGSSAGKIYSVATVGSIFGTFFSTFFLIPLWGTRATLIACIAMLFIISLTGMSVFSRNYKHLMLLPIFFLAFLSHNPHNSNVIFEKDSFYNLVIVERSEDSLYLKLNENKYFHSVNGEDFFRSYLVYFLAGPLLTGGDVKDIAVLGMGAGSSILELKNLYPDVKIDAVEIDPVVVDTAYRYFGLSDVKDIKTYIEDARTFVRSNNKMYDILEIDLFQGGPYTPFYTATKEFFSDCYGSLKDSGLVMMNILDMSDEKIIAGPIENTILTVFPKLYEVRYGSNYIVFAFKEDVTKEDIAQRLSSQSIFNKKMFLEELKEVRFNNSLVVFTDDLAPIERLTYRMLKENLV